MGWLWSSSPKTGESNESKDDSAQSPGFNLTDEQRTRILGRAGFTPQPKTDTPSKPQSQEQQADAELDAFLKSFSDADPGTVPNSELAEPSTSQQPREATNHDRILPDGSLNINPSALYPRTMSCRQAFDQAFYCQSVGGKFNDVYRYGRFKDCNEQWGAFWFCMRTRTLPDEQKQQRIAQYYEDREKRRKAEFGSSEDVWELRTKPIEKAFWKNPDDNEGLQRALRKQ